MPRDFVTDHVAKQIVRSSTSPAACYAEARAAESRTDFVHKMQVCLKELRETAVWLAFIEEFAAEKVDITRLREEGQELVMIFATSVRTARARSEKAAKSPLPSPQSPVPNPDSPVPSPQS
jgi:four helix bundle protein